MDKNETKAAEGTATTLKLIRMNEVATEAIKWLWYPYIPFGKITVIQGDPGDGIITAVLAIVTTITTSTPLPESKSIGGCHFSNRRGL